MDDNDEKSDYFPKDDINKCCHWTMMNSSRWTPFVMFCCLKCIIIFNWLFTEVSCYFIYQMFFYVIKTLNETTPIPLSNVTSCTTDGVFTLTSLIWMCILYGCTWIYQCVYTNRKCLDSQIY
jgi:hypothetical protein